MTLQSKQSFDSFIKNKSISQNQSGFKPLRSRTAIICYYSRDAKVLIFVLFFWCKNCVSGYLESIGRSLVPVSPLFLKQNCIFGIVLKTLADNLKDQN